MPEIAPETLELPDNESVAVTQCLEASIETTPVVPLARRKILVQLFGADTGCDLHPLFRSTFAVSCDSDFGSDP